VTQLQVQTSFLVSFNSVSPSVQKFSLNIFSCLAMRDPVFYRWHKFIDSIFQTHKNRMKPYERSELTFENILVDAIQIGSVGGRPNVIDTHWQQSDINLAKGLDFVPQGDVMARFELFVLKY
jgi:hypothetical protein